MFELDEIMRQRESKVFAEILNRLREGNHTPSDLQKLKERCVVEESECPTEAPRLFIQNALVDEYNDKVYQSFNSGNKYTIKAQDSVISACSTELKEIIRQIPYVLLKNSKQLAHKLNIAVGQRTEIAINIRTDDGMTNGVSNVIKHIQLTNNSKQ